MLNSSDYPIDLAASEFGAYGVEAGFLVPTETGLSKSVLDAHLALRIFLETHGVHDFASQEQGTEARVLRPAEFVYADRLVPTQVSFYRPATKSGDPRLWIYGLGGYAKPGNLVGLLASPQGQLYIVNLSIPEIRESLVGKGTPLHALVLEFASGHAQAEQPPTHQPRPDRDVSAGDRWHILSQLWSRATGGTDVAARPDSEQDCWPAAPSAPGVDEATAWFRARLEDVSSRPTLLFLVGGPGAGKSYAAARAVKGLSRLDDEDDGLAHRRYQYTTKGLNLVVVNDATITGEGELGRALAADISNALSDPAHLLACVNRGVLVEELAAHARGTNEALDGALIISWLHAPRPEASQAGSLEVEPLATHSYIRSAALHRAGEHIADAVAVYVDVCSLLETRPSVEWTASSSTTELQPEPYSVTRLTRRGVSHQRGTPAGVLFATVLERIEEASDAAADISFDPVRANVESLLDAEVATGVLTFLRSAEIAASKRLAYREIWGALVRSLIGWAPETVAPNGLRDLLLRLQPDPNATGTSQWEALQRLASLRFSEALVGVGQFDGSVDLTVNPVTRVLWPMDPVRDARPGSYKARTWSSGWATPVVDAFSGQVVASSPLETLLEGIDPGDAMRRAAKDFDWALDKAFVETSRAVPTAARQEMISWYGAYLMRLYALANGISAFRPEVALWTQAWRDAPNLPDALDATLTTLVRPKREPADPASSVLVPLFDSRTTPIVGFQAEPRVALKTEGVELTTIRDGETLFLQLTEKSRSVGQIELDFPLIRESLACTVEHVGVTEQTSVASPRLERFRAARLAPKLLRGAKYRIVAGSSEYTFTVED
ncbi:hypothetical protein [Phycicoccus sp. SLBN-51]|uniref:hypothetical protein n=1 Tax=Phycicoccus sp. SLBN-51 TaxID=2768447 RepID=UPI001152D693|nr:hypothetical protein [Phycicoccus sp. SLBN-51]TQJ50191.1 hypothetical protein FBY26_1891 [Phycicoccus sp. SLBN-51]